MADQRGVPLLLVLGEMRELGALSVGLHRQMGEAAAAKRPALLITIAVPRYFSHIERAKEATLKQDLSVMRDAIDKFYGDKGRYPETLEELTKERYIREVPIDPFTESATSWTILPPADAKEKGQVYDVKSGADGKSSDGKAYSEW